MVSQPCLRPWRPANHLGLPVHVFLYALVFAMVMTPAPVSQMHWHHWLSCRADREHVKLDRDVMLPALVGVSLLTPNLPKPDVSTVNVFPNLHVNVPWQGCGLRHQVFLYLAVQHCLVCAIWANPLLLGSKFFEPVKLIQLYRPKKRFVSGTPPTSKQRWWCSSLKALTWHV